MRDTAFASRRARSLARSIVEELTLAVARVINVSFASVI